MDGGCRLWGCTESDTTEVTWQQQQLYFYVCSAFRQFWYVVLVEVHE